VWALNVRFDLLAAAHAGEVTPGRVDRYLMIQCRDGVAKKMTPDQIAEAQHLEPVR
jgi:hypothetical protein